MNRFAAIATGIFVTFLWSSSYILNKLAFDEGINPFMLAGLRYTIAVLVLVLISYFWNKRRRSTQSESATATRLSMKQYLLLGITGYLMAQGLQYAGQFFISPTQTSMLLLMKVAC